MSRQHKADTMSPRHTTGQQNGSGSRTRRLADPHVGDDAGRRSAPWWAPSDGLGGLWLLTPAIAAAWITAIVADRDGLPGEHDGEITRWWLLSLVLLLSGAGWPVLAPAVRAIATWPTRTWRWLTWSSWAPWIGMIALAALPRLVWLDRFPTVLDGDGSAFMMRAVAFREGELPGWFHPGFYGNPNLYPVVQSLVADAVGDGVTGHRTLSALLGAIGVVAAWRLGRHLVGEPSATIGAILLAAWPLHLHMSRVALNNITDPTFLTLALLFLVRATRFRRRLDAVACGMALAFALHGFFGGRAFPVVILALLPVLAVTHRLGLVATLRALAWMTVGFAVTAMPLLVAFRRIPAEFGGHMAMVSPFTLENLRADPSGTLATYLPNLWEAVIYPLAGNNQGSFRHEPPYFGLPLAILLVVGAVVLATRWLRGRELPGAACLLVPWGLLTAGIATTIPITGHRLLALTPLFALVCGSGLWRLAILTGRIARSRLPGLEPLLAALAALTFTVGHLAWMSSEDRQLETYSDRRTVAAYDLGWRLSGDGASRPAVLFVGAPFVWSHSFPSLTFLVDSMPMTDIEHPLINPGDVPPLPESTLLVMTPERADERCVVENALPGVTVAEARDRYGSLIYLAFHYGHLAGWSTTPSPAGSTLAPAEGSPCDSGIAAIEWRLSSLQG